MALVVFDLDFTLWDCGGLWIDCTDPPFRHGVETGTVEDRTGRVFRLYPDVPEILARLEEDQHQLGVASRTHRPDWAHEVLELLGLAERFPFQEIYPGSKVPHFRSLRERSGFDYGDMVFFDDEERNVREVGALGVHAVGVGHGVSMAIVERAMRDLDAALG